MHKGVYQRYQVDALEKRLNSDQRYLETHSPETAQHWVINFPTERTPFLGLSWQLPLAKGQRRGKVEEHVAFADGSGMISEVHESLGGDFFYRLHFDLNYMSLLRPAI